MDDGVLRIAEKFHRDGAGREAKMLIDELIPTIDVPWKIFER